MFNTPLKKASLFLVIVLLYFLLGYLNYTRALKISAFGFFAIGFFSSLQTLYKNRLTNFLLITVALLAFSNLLFHSILRDIFGVAQDDLIVIQAIMDTDSSETKEFFLQYYSYLIKHIILIIVVGYSYIRYILFAPSKSSKKSLYIFGVLLVLLHLNPTMRHTNPINYVYHYYNEYKWQISQTNKLNSLVSQNLKNSKFHPKYIGKEKKNTIVWIIGESETKYNWSLYGYKRDTNKYLEKIKDKLKIFHNITASAPATVPAFKLMLTDANKSNPSSWIKYPNIVLLAKMAGYKTYWISNHTSDSRGAINIFAKSADKLVLTNKGRSRGEGSYDEVILPHLKSALNDNSDKKFIIIHMLEAHPAYDYRYPKKFSIFTYNFSDSVIKNLLKEGRSKFALVFRNQYDNAVLYSDYNKYNFIEAIKHSKDANVTTVVYHPDHGEDVCHNTNFSGHNFKAIQQWQIPMFAWGRYKDKVAQNVKNSFCLDNINRVILNILSVKVDK